MHWTSRVAVLLATCLSVGAVIAAGPLVDIRWDSAGQMRHHAHIAPGKFLEVCGPLLKGQKVDWQFGASLALDFNVHFHVGKAVSYPERRNAVSKASATLVVESAQDYCWMWTNTSTQMVHLDLQLHTSPP